MTLAALLVSTAALLSAGCGTSVAAPKVDKVFQAQVTTMRGYFNKVSGNYDQLAGPDKEAYIKAAGGDPKVAADLWDKMKYGPGGAPKGTPKTAP